MTQNPILSSFLLSLFLILGIIFLWLPKYQALNNLRFEIKEKEIEFQNKEQYFQQLENLSEQLKGYSSELAKIRSALPSSPDIANTFHFIMRIASGNGLILEKVSLGETVPLKENSSIKKTQFSFSLSGSYSSFKNFLFNPQNINLQNSSRLISLEEISFKSPIKEKETFSFDLKVRTHSY